MTAAITPAAKAGTVRWGLLSTARIGGTVLEATRGSAHTRFVAVGGRDALRARAFADRHGLPSSYGSYEELLAAADVDAVYVALPASLHTEWTVKALRAGKHVLCEKPFATSAGDATAAFDAAGDAGLICAEGFMWRYHPQTALVRKLLADGAIGRLRTVRAALSVDVPPGDIRLDRALGGGALLDLGCYCVCATRLFAGFPEQVYATAVRGPGGVDLRMAATMRFPDGVLGQFDIGLDLPRRDELELIGSEGVITVRDPWVCKGSPVELRRENETVRVPVPAMPPELHGEVTPADAVYRIELDAVSVALAGGAPLPFGRRDAVEQAAVLAALAESAQLGRPVVPTAPVPAALQARADR